LPSGGSGATNGSAARPSGGIDAIYRMLQESFGIDFTDTRHVLAAILTIGNEVVSGDTENTNASWLGRRLEQLGVKVAISAAIPDELDRIVGFVRREGPAVDHGFGAHGRDGRSGEGRRVKRLHDPALPDDIRRPRDARPGRRQSQDVALAAIDRDEIREARMALRNGIDRDDACAQLRLEVGLDPVAHSRWAMSPMAPAMRRSPSARTTLMLV